MGDSGFSKGFFGCLGVGCAVVFALGVCLISGVMLLGWGASKASKAIDEEIEAAKREPVATSTTQREASRNVTPFASSREPITFAKYKQIETGMSLEQCVQLMGQSGEEMSSSEAASPDGSHATTLRVWTWKNTFGSNCTVVFVDGKVQSKAQFGLK